MQLSPASRGCTAPAGCWIWCIFHVRRCGACVRAGAASDSWHLSLPLYGLSGLVEKACGPAAMFTVSTKFPDLASQSLDGSWSWTSNECVLQCKAGCRELPNIFSFFSGTPVTPRGVVQSMATVALFVRVGGENLRRRAGVIPVSVWARGCCLFPGFRTNALAAQEAERAEIPR